LKLLYKIKYINMVLNLEAIKKKYNSVPFGIVGSFLIFLSIN
jgi:hypothetical protein